MVKVKQIICDKCGKKFKSKKAIVKHKCGQVLKKNQKSPCPECQRPIDCRHMAQHIRRCKRAKFQTIYSEFLSALNIAIKRINMNIKINNWVGDENDQKRFIYKARHLGVTNRKKIEIGVTQINLKKEKGFLLEKIDDIEEPIIALLKDEFPGLKDSLIRPFLERKEKLFPSISIREVVTRFLHEIGMDQNIEVISYINNRYKTNDYPTDNELKAIPGLYESILILRGEFKQWNILFTDLYYKLKQYTENRNLFKCHYCFKISFNKRHHLIRCKNAKMAYEIDRRAFIKDYINHYYSNYKLDLDQQEILVAKGIDYDYELFLKHFHSIFYYRNKHFEEAQPKQVVQKPNDKKRFLSELLTEINNEDANEVEDDEERILIPKSLNSSFEDDDEDKEEPKEPQPIEQTLQQVFGYMKNGVKSRNKKNIKYITHL